MGTSGEKVMSSTDTSTTANANSAGRRRGGRGSVSTKVVLLVGIIGQTAQHAIHDAESREDQLIVGELQSHRNSSEAERKY